MAIGIVATQSGVFGSGGGTTTAIDTTGATGLIIGLWWNRSSPFNGRLSDSKANAFSSTTLQHSGAGNVQLFYVAAPTVGSGHTFTTLENFAGIGILALNGTANPISDKQSGAVSVTGFGNLQPGSITPSFNNSIIVSAFTDFNGPVPTFPAGYTVLAANPTATAEGGGMCFKIQTSLAAENPLWTAAGSTSNECVVIANFLAAGATTNTGNSKFFFFLNNLMMKR